MGMRLSSRAITLVEILTANKALTADPSVQHPEDIADTYAAFKVIEGLVKARLDQLRDVLMGEAEMKGTPVGEKGAVKVNAGEATVIREKRTATMPDFDGLKALVSEKGLAATDAFDELKVLEVNPSKVQHLVDTGKLKPDAVEALKRVSFTLKVQPSGQAKLVLEQAVPSKVVKG